MFNAKVAPNEFARGVGAIERIGDYVARYGSRALVIGGRRALGAALAKMQASFEVAKVSFDVEEFSGYCSQNMIKRYADKVEAGRYDLVVGVGGGRALDCVKAVGDVTWRPVITVPTIAATCAAWSSVSVSYSDEGIFEGSISLRRSPVVAIVDSRILCDAPVRYLAAGIGDALAKWYEVPLNVKITGEDSASIRSALALTDLCNRMFRELGRQALEDAGRGEVTETLERIIDAVIMLTGLISGLAGDACRLAVGHSIYNCMSHFKASSASLHGEKVAFGLAVQQVLEGRSLTEVNDYLIFLKKELGLPVTLGQLGLCGISEAEISHLAELVAQDPAVKSAPFDGNVANIRKAILTVDDMGKKLLD
ncbi:MAG: iron-containing alcohol dehydrogenase family protein [Firmicutes bacterium]|nr:iron-containing alcohol dehydrogenase family protein [Bacillota bacterium]